MIFTVHITLNMNFIKMYSLIKRQQDTIFFVLFVDGIQLIKIFQQIITLLE